MHHNFKGLCGPSKSHLTDPWLQRTVLALENVFDSVYQINHNRGSLGVAIGRYPEDRYYGGNPWFLTTLSFAEYYHRLARELESSENIDGSEGIEITAMNRPFYASLLGSKLPAKLKRNSPLFIELITELKSKGDSFFQRVKGHSAVKGNLSEQFDRNAGYMKSARDLTWSYASFLAAYWARN